MKREDAHTLIERSLNLDSEKCTLVPISEKKIRIYFDDMIREADIERFKYRIKEYWDVIAYSHYTIDLFKKKSLHSLKTA